MRKRTIVILAIVWMVVLVAGVSSAVTMAVCGVLGSQSQLPASTTYQVDAQQYGMIERYERLEQVRRQLEENYYRELDTQELVLGAVRGMLAAVEDPYTFYYTPEEMEEAAQQNLGLYQGVGLLIASDKAGYVRVLRVFQDSPAWAAGVRAGDRVLEVDGQAVSGETQQTLEEAISRMQVAQGELLRLTLQRDDEILTLGMTPSTVQMARVECQVLQGQVGYIALYEFVGDDVEGFRQAMDQLSSQGVKKVILDLRSNPGGRLDDVVEIADLLMGEGLIVYTVDRYGQRSEYFSDGQMWDVELAVLVNDMSASASEILAAALQDAGRAVIVGEQTFGKGIVQTQITFREDGAGMQLTTASYYTPSGRSIHGVGVMPDIQVEMDEENFSGTLSLEQDPQLRAAWQVLMD